MTTPQEMEERLDDLRRVGIECAQMAAAYQARQLDAASKLVVDTSLTDLSPTPDREGDP